MNTGLDRRQFITLTALAAGTSLTLEGQNLEAPQLLGRARKEAGPAPVSGASWFVAEAAEDGLLYKFPAGTLAKAICLTADMLLDGTALAVFLVTLREGEQGRVFRFSFGGLNQCSFRFRMDLALVDQRLWLAEREGAFLKPSCGGDRVDLDKVDRLTLTILRKGPDPVRWCMTALQALPEMIPRLEHPVLPKGHLVDALGQSTLTDWPGKTRNADELIRRIGTQFELAPKQAWPESCSQWGGWKSRKLSEGTGFFRTHNDGRRWWLVDPDGYAFWSAGLDCVRVDCAARVDGIESALSWIPDSAGERERPGARMSNFLAANMARALGDEGWREKWSQIALAELKRLRFNTVGNWSEWEFAAKAKFPYVRPMTFRGERCGMVYRDFPDVFHAGFPQDATDYASQLKNTANDPAFIGYFLMNEPTWGFSTELPAAGMLYNTPECATRVELASFLKKKYAADEALSSAWNQPATFARITSGKWSGVFTAAALADLREFSVLMVERYFQVISKACKQADPNHLNLGMRWAGVPPEWAVRGMKYFDVFSLNCYMDKFPLEQAEKIHAMLKMPVMIGEWHFGALDAGLPASGIGHLKNQADRAKAYRVYLEDAAADPYCVGAHWFTLYDQSALGRFDGENYNIGFLDICNRPYDELCNGAIASHERMYNVASGNAKPFAGAPEYLPRLFL